MNLSRILAPLFLCVLAGVLMGRWRKIRPEPFVTAVMDLFMPALVFDALLTAPVSLADMLTSGVASAIIIGLLFILCLLARPLFGRPLRAFALPVLFMNAGFIGMPLMSLAFGAEALGLIVIFDQVQSFFMFTLGIWIANRHGTQSDLSYAPSPAAPRSAVAESLAAFLREPLMYSILIAVALRAAGITIPEKILAPIRFVGSVTPPLALFALGLRLAATPLRFLSDRATIRILAGILILRFGGGLLAGSATIAIMRIDGLTRQVVWIASALPSAVFSYILAERYNADPDIAASAVFASTIASAIILPLILRFAA